MLPRNDGIVPMSLLLSRALVDRRVKHVRETLSRRVEKRGESHWRQMNQEKILNQLTDNSDSSD